METGGIVLMGGGEVGDAELGAWLLSRSRGPRVVALATAAAFDAPEQAMVGVASWLNALGAEVEGLMVLHRSEAALEEMAQRVAGADLVYLVDGAALHLRSTLKGTAVLDGLRHALSDGALIVASGASAVALCDPMVDPRGGAPTVGLGLVTELSVVAHVGSDPDDESGEKFHRGLSLFASDLPVVALPEKEHVVIASGTVTLSHGATVYLGGSVRDDLFTRS
jgi:cyanophycinase